MKMILSAPSVPHSWGNWEGAGGHPHAPAKGAKPLVESPIENSGESREARPLWWRSGGYPPDSLLPPLLQERGQEVRYQYTSWRKDE